jgi:hypothetical protein
MRRSSPSGSVRPSFANGDLRRQSAVLNRRVEDSVRLGHKAAVEEEAAAIAVVVAAVVETTAMAVVAVTSANGILKFFFPQESPVVIESPPGHFFRQPHNSS